MFTRQHYKRIAQIIRANTYLDAKKFEPYIKKDTFLLQLGVMFTADNPNFDWQTFEQACNLPQ